MSAYFSGSIQIRGVFSDFSPPNLLPQIAGTPLGPWDLSPALKPRWAGSDFQPPNLLTPKVLKLPPFIQRDDLLGRVQWKGVYSDFLPPNLLADKFLRPPPVASVDLSQRVSFRWAATDFAPPNLLTPKGLPLPPFTQSSDSGRLFGRGVYADFAAPNLSLTLLGAVLAPIAPIDLSQAVRAKGSVDSAIPNLTLNLPKPPIAPTEWNVRLTARGIFTDFAAPNLILNTLTPLVPAPVRPQDISDIGLDARSSRSDFVPPNLILTLPIVPAPVSGAAGRHKSRAEAHARHHRDVLRARVEAFKEQRLAAEAALENSESREARVRTQTLKRVKVTRIKKPLEQYAPVKRAIAQRNIALQRYRDILGSLERAQEAHTQLEREIQQTDEEAALYFIQFLMWEAGWRE